MSTPNYLKVPRIEQVTRPDLILADLWPGETFRRVGDGAVYVKTDERGIVNLSSGCGTVWPINNENSRDLVVRVKVTATAEDA